MCLKQIARLSLPLCLFIVAPTAGAQESVNEVGVSAVRMLQANRLAGDIRIDGRLDEADWERAQPATGFTESYPNAGAAANERTEARVLWDDQAIYVGVRLFDSNPDSIAAPLARRDAAGIYSDWLHLIVDSYHDRRTSFRFSVNPRGVQRDVYMYNDGEEDASWDAVWEVATQMDSLGWTAEYRIPLSQLRYEGQVEGERVWGFQIMRDIARRQQRLSWSPWNRQSPGFVSRFGELRGIDGIRPVRRIEVQPYTSARLTRAPSDTLNPFFRSNASRFAGGADVKVGLTSGLTLTGTINPDFGQVELDPAVINLSAFESFFSERRPFFVEGADVFRFGQVRSNINIESQTFFYSRRIGRSPQRLLQGGQFAYVDAPQETSILGAAKVTGKVGPWTMGIMSALTDQEEARFTTPDGQLSTTLVEPRTNFFLSRLRREFRTGGTVLGSMFSTTNRRLEDGGPLDGLLRSGALFGGVDFEHLWAARAWSLSGYAAASHVRGSEAAMLRTQHSPARYFQRPDADHVSLDLDRTAMTGHIAEIALRHLGAWDLSLGYKESSPGFELNDLGFQGLTDYRQVTAFFGRRVN
ncbi:MAG: carbohydrate binding family 9 domain-containing protein, partial [Gemmatimonadetes bacterium]|nr:carbohydrate binding family 9 domain-containing protein [Gemmatimonadota bacterium]